MVSIHRGEWKHGEISQVENGYHLLKVCTTGKSMFMFTEIILHGNYQKMFKTVMEYVLYTVPQGEISLEEKWKH